MGEIFIPGKENSIVTCGKECQYFIDQPKVLPKTGQNGAEIAFAFTLVIIITAIIWRITR